MLISFFEEFPTKDNLAKLKLVTWKTKAYIAARSASHFSRIRQQVLKMHHQHVQEVIYWPILKRQEGYWISPFSQRPALQRIFQELQGKDIPVMLDLELPTRQNPWLYLTQSIYFWQNKRLIGRFIKQYQGEIYLAEYYPDGKKSERLLQLLGLHYVHPKVKVIKMLYRSLHHFSDGFLREELLRGKQEYGPRFIPAFGVITLGIHGNEQILSPERLEHDVQIAKKAGIKEVIIFRLGGLTKKYQALLKRYT